VTYRDLIQAALQDLQIVGAGDHRHHHRTCGHHHHAPVAIGAEAAVLAEGDDSQEIR
jgi:hypothetical protein